MSGETPKCLRVEICLEDSGVTQQQADTTRKGVSRVEELRINPDVVFRPQLSKQADGGSGNGGAVVMQPDPVPSSLRAGTRGP
jgi:hypothetical protein